MKISPWVGISIVVVLLMTAGAYAYVSFSVGTKIEISNVPPTPELPVAPLKKTPKGGETPPTSVACTMEAKQCPDGSSVSRQGPKCEFTACPEAKSAPDLSLRSETPYTNEKHSYTIYAPKDWTTDTSKSNYFVDTIFLDSKTDTEGKNTFRTNINVGAVPIKIAGITSLKDCVTPEKLAKLFTNYISTGDAFVTVNGVPARVFGGTYDLGEYHLRNQQLQMVENGFLYDVTATALASKWDTHANNIEASLHSLTIK